MKIAVGADHRGAEAARELISHLNAAGHEVTTFGQCDGNSCDYPDLAYEVAIAVRDAAADRGVLVCGTGIGMCIAANKIQSVRAALVHDQFTAEASRRHNDANILCMSGDMMARDEIIRIVDAWLATEFEGGRHQRRVNKIAAIENGSHPADGDDTDPAPADNPERATA